MKRPITGYHQDEHGDWIAELSCDHGQHVRHKPPFTLRPWVNSVEGRGSMLGTELDCVRCDRFEIPAGYIAYKRTAVFDESSIPPGLKKNHSTKPGVWGVIHVLSGRLRYCIDGPDGGGGRDGRELMLDPETPGIILPEMLHHIVAADPVRFFVEFHRKSVA